MTPEQIKANIENGKQCPECGNYEVSATGVFDAGSLKELWGCHECGTMGDEDEFNAPEAEAHPSDRCPPCLLRCEDAFPNCGATLEQRLADEANWPPMNWITRVLWHQMTPEMRARQVTAPRQECFEPRADGRVENFSIFREVI